MRHPLHSPITDPSRILATQLSDCASPEPPGDRNPHAVPGAAANPGRNRAERKAQQWLAERGQNPTDDAIAALVERRRAASRRDREADRHTEFVRHAGREHGHAAALFVASHLEQAGYGPTWRELADHMEWPPAAHVRIIRRLASKRWLEFTTAPRSLRPGPRYRAGGVL